jgi:hypothetical protein
LVEPGLVLVRDHEEAVLGPGPPGGVIRLCVGERVGQLPLRDAVQPGLGYPDPVHLKLIGERHQNAVLRTAEALSLERVTTMALARPPTRLAVRLWKWWTITSA